MCVHLLYIKLTPVMISPGTYVRVYGHLRQWESINRVIAFRFNLVEDFNEITFHFLDAVHGHLFHVKKGINMPNPRDFVAPQKDGASATQFGSTQQQQQQTQQTQSTTEAAFSTNVREVYDQYADPNQNEFDKVCEAVLSVVRSASSNPAGIHVEQVYESLSATFVVDEINKAINHLGTEGHIYNSIDDFHVRCQ
jgi:replication factor A2